MPNLTSENKMTKSNNMQAANELFAAFISEDGLELDSAEVKQVSFMERYYGASVGASVLRSTPTHVYVD